jgi:hypothetical protein
MLRIWNQTIIYCQRQVGFRELESIDRLKKVQKFVVDFILSLDSELAVDEANLPEDNCCVQLERYARRMHFVTTTVSVASPQADLCRGQPDQVG